MHVYHGKGRHISLDKLEQYDVVLTTYTLMALEAPLHVGGRRTGTQNKPVDLCSDSSSSEDEADGGSVRDAGTSGVGGSSRSPLDSAQPGVAGARTLL